MLYPLNYGGVPRYLNERTGVALKGGLARTVSANVEPQPVPSRHTAPRECAPTTIRRRYGQGRQPSGATNAGPTALAERAGSSVPLAGLEPATRCLEGSRSIHLSYRGALIASV